MSKEISKNLKSYRNTDEYKLLVEDSQSILTEGIFRSRQELIDTYKQLGERIQTDPLYKKWGQDTQGKFMRELAGDIGKSVQVLYYAGQFYEKLMTDKEFSTAVEKLGKNVSWNKIRKLLPGSKNEKQIPLPKGKYQVIYADPPWRYWEGGEKNQSRHYPTMDIEAIKALPVQDLAADNCILV